METIGAILMIVGFCVGIYGGLTLSRPEVMIDDKGNIDTGKQMQVCILTSASALAMIAGFLFFFGGL